ncbi:hypothetical protein MNV49_006048 [Pseudohyphozyma bogoriensis]|nr:hypothetical protein MNV49_006048 [Pseudohyphozyma bogoriensis]
MRPTTPRFGGGAQYPYPKEVWSPAGGWWTRPANWKSSTVYAGLSVAFLTWGVWKFSADREWRHVAPTKPIPSMMWAKQFTSGEMGVRDESHLKGTPSADHH